MKNTKLNSFVILFVLMWLSPALLTADGKPGDVPHDVTETEFWISSKAHLDSVAVAVNDPNNWWKSSGKTFILYVDIAGFTGTIGTSYSPFMGIFDGNSHRIDVNISKTNDYGVGLFDKAKNAIIKNLTVSGTVTGVSYAAGIVGHASNVWIEHCTNLANVTAVDHAPEVVSPGWPEISYSTRALTLIRGCFVGGIVGYGDANGVTIVKCANAGKIAGTSYTGGIIGEGSKNAEIFQCVNIGTVRGENSTGGIAGSTANTIENSMNAGFVVGGSSVGGIAGNCGTMANCTVIRHCLNTGVVHASFQTGSIAGYMPNTTNAIDNFYDKQMSPIGGMAGNDYANRAEGKLTSELTGNSLFAWNNFWTMHTLFNPQLYPTPIDAGNVYYTTAYDYANNHLEHVAAATIKLYADSYFWETADYVSSNFFTHTWQAVNWTAQLGNIKVFNSNSTSSSIDATVWSTMGAINIGDTMVSTCSAYSKQVPIYIPHDIWYKTTTETDYATNAFSIGEVTPNIVTSNATIDIQTSTEGNLNVSIYDLAGTKVANVTDKFVNANTSLQVDLNNLSNLAAGSYMAVVAVGKEVVMRKFVNG